MNGYAGEELDVSARAVVDDQLWVRDASASPSPLWHHLTRMSDPREPLGTDEARLYLACPGIAADPALRTEYLALLRPDERQRYERFMFEHSRHEYLLTRALIRTVLSRVTGIGPNDFEFAAGPHGRPHIKKPRLSNPPRFNLSNTRGLVVCLITRDREVGVDVESLDRRGELLDAADHYLSQREVTDLRARPEEAQRRGCLEYWTLKESYVKARGLGLAIPLGQFSFLLSAGQRPEIAFHPPLEADPRCWRFALLRPTENHLVATAMEHRDGAPDRPRIIHTIPLRD